MSVTESPMPGGPWNVDRLEEQFPWVKWREPQRVSIAGGHGSAYICRICVANHGVKAREVLADPHTYEEVVEHIATEHRLTQSD